MNSIKTDANGALIIKKSAAVWLLTALLPAVFGSGWAVKAYVLAQIPEQNRQNISLLEARVMNAETHNDVQDDQLYAMQREVLQAINELSRDVGRIQTALENPPLSLRVR